jgi:GTP-binding protein YchF
MLQAGIVGLPNVGKSTLFNALTRSRKAEAANYPFCTIEPNVGMVEVPDERLQVLQKIVKTQVVIPAVIEFVDIAGLVAGASKGEGLGSKFLDHIRKVDAIVQVVRCFDDTDIVHNMGSVDPVRDIDVIITELILADIESAEEQLKRSHKKIKAQEKEALANSALLQRIVDHLYQTKPVYTLEVTVEEAARLKHFGMLTEKPILYACNVSEKDLANPLENKHVQAVQAYVKKSHHAAVVVLCAQVEADVAELSIEEAKSFLTDLGIADSGVSGLIRATYDLLGLASYFTAGEKEVRAWTFRKGMKAPECAGVIHTDFCRGFIKAEIVGYEDLAKAATYDAVRKAGKYRLEGKDYIFQDGDVAIFKFNVT